MNPKWKGWGAHSKGILSIHMYIHTYVFVCV